MAYAHFQSTVPQYAALGGGCPACNVSFGPAGCVPCEPGYSMPECQGCFGDKSEESFFSRHDIWPQVISATLIAVISGVVIVQLNKRGLKTA